MSYTIGQVAGFSGVSVRTLRHYEEVGLLMPGHRSRAGYRHYVDADLDRLQQILFYRALGFRLDEIVTILDDPTSDPAVHLRRQHRLLRDRIDHLRRMLAAVEFAIQATRKGVRLTPKEKFEVFGDFDPDVYEEEVRQRWGSTEAYQESARRTASMTKQDWQEYRSEQDDWGNRLARVMESGAASTSDAAMALAEEHRGGIGRWFYECSYEMHRGLAQMYVTDARFTEHYERIKPGMAVFLHDAIQANADRAEASTQR